MLKVLSEMASESWEWKSDEEEIFDTKQLGVDKYEVSKAELNDPLRKIKTEISSLLLSQKDYVTARQVLLLYEEAFDFQLYPQEYGFKSVAELLDAMDDKLMKTKNQFGEYVYKQRRSKAFEDIKRLVDLQRRPEDRVYGRYRNGSCTQTRWKSPYSSMFSRNNNTQRTTMYHNNNQHSFGDRNNIQPFGHQFGNTGRGSGVKLSDNGRRLFQNTIRSAVHHNKWSNPINNSNNRNSNDHDNLGTTKFKAEVVRIGEPTRYKREPLQHVSPFLDTEQASMDEFSDIIKPLGPEESHILKKLTPFTLARPNSIPSERELPLSTDTVDPMDYKMSKFFGAEKQCVPPLPNVREHHIDQAELARVRKYLAGKYPQQAAPPPPSNNFSVPPPSIGSSTSNAASSKKETITSTNLLARAREALDYDSETENDNSTITGNEDNDHGDSNNTTSSSTVFRNVMEKDLDWMKNCFLVFNGSQQDFHQCSPLAFVPPCSVLLSNHLGNTECERYETIGNMLKEHYDTNEFCPMKKVVPGCMAVVRSDDDEYIRVAIVGYVKENDEYICVCLDYHAVVEMPAEHITTVPEHLVNIPCNTFMARLHGLMPIPEKIWNTVRSMIVRKTSSNEYNYPAFPTAIFGFDESTDSMVVDWVLNFNSDNPTWQSESFLSTFTEMFPLESDPPSPPAHFAISGCQVTIDKYNASQRSTEKEVSYNYRPTPRRDPESSSNTAAPVKTVVHQVKSEEENIGDDHQIPSKPMNSSQHGVIQEGWKWISQTYTGLNSDINKMRFLLGAKSCMMAMEESVGSSEWIQVNENIDALMSRCKL